MTDLEKILLTAIGAIVVGVFVKIIWNQLQPEGQRKTTVYMTCDECKAIRDNCDIGKIQFNVQQYHEEMQTYKAKTDTRLSVIEDKLIQGSKDFRVIKDDISNIKIVMTRMETLLENNIVQVIPQNNKA